MLDWESVPPDDPSELPEGARRLLLGPVDSFEKLEVLLALHQAAGTPMALGAVAARACLTVEQVESALAGLAATRLVERRADGAWRIPDSPDTEAVAELATAWTTCRPAVLKAMTSRAVSRIRASAARVFADAFRLRRPKDGGDDDG